MMEYVEGQGLDDVIASTDLSQSEILQIALEISSAFEVVHNHGVGHRKRVRQLSTDRIRFGSRQLHSYDLLIS